MISGSTWICNRCGEAGEGPIGDLPTGWVGIYCSTTLSLMGSLSRLGDICPACVCALDDFWLAETTTAEKIRAVLLGTPQDRA